MLRRRGPGLVRTVAATAVVAGTAGAVHHMQDQRWQRKEQEQYEQQQAQYEQQAAQQAAFDNQAQMAQMQDQLATLQAQQAQAAIQAQQAAPAPAPAAPAGGTDVTARLKELGDLKAAGVLTDEEFAAAKAKVLSGG